MKWGGGEGGQFDSVPDADQACLEAQNIWGAADFLGASTLSCKKDKSSRSEHFQSNR